MVRRAVSWPKWSRVSPLPVVQGMNHRQGGGVSLLGEVRTATGVPSREEDGRGVRRARGEGVATPVGMDGYDDRVSARGGREKRGPALGWTKRNPPSSSSFRVDDYARLLSNYRRIIMIDGYRWVCREGGFLGFIVFRGGLN